MAKIFNGNFSNLSEIITILNDTDIIIAHGTYNNTEQDPGEHISLASPNSNKMYDFIKTHQDERYILVVRNI